MTNENEIGKIYAFAFKPGENTGNLGDIFGYLAIEKLGKRTLTHWHPRKRQYRQSYNSLSRLYPQSHQTRTKCIDLWTRIHHQ